MKKLALAVLVLLSLGISTAALSADLSKKPDVPEIPITELDWGIY